MVKTIDMSNFTIRKMRAFCDIHEALDKGATETLGDLCLKMGVGQEFIGDLEFELFGTAGRGKLAARRGVHRSTDLGALVHKHFKLAVDAANDFACAKLIAPHRIRVQATRSAINSGVAQAYAAFKARDPISQVELVVKDGFSRENKEAVLAGDSHYGVGYRESAFKDVESLSVLTTRFVLVCHKDEEDAQVDKLLARKNVIFLPDVSVFSNQVAALLSGKQSRAVTLPGIVYVIEWVRQKLGVAFVPHAFIPPDYAELHLGWKDLDDQIPVKVFLYRHVNHNDYSAPAARFWDDLVKAFQDLDDAVGDAKHGKKEHRNPKKGQIHDSLR